MSVIGIGNGFRNDDGIGLLAARQLETLQIPGVDVVTLTGDGGDLLRVWDKKSTTYLIDAVASDSPGGTVHRIDLNLQLLSPEMFRHSSHAFGVADSVELARILGTLPERCILFGIEGGDFGMGTTISPAVTRGADETVKTIRGEIQPEVATEMSVPSFDFQE